MTTLIDCFRNDLRLHDNPAFTWACSNAQRVLPVCLVPETETTAWGFARVGPHRQASVAAARASLNQQLQALGSRLFCLKGSMANTLPALVRQTGAQAVVCEEIATPEERDDVQALRDQGITRLAKQQVLQRHGSRQVPGKRSRKPAPDTGEQLGLPI